MNKEAVAAWLERYVEAWKSYDPQAIGDLFSENAEYYYGPYQQPVRAREAIVASWLEDRDQPGTYASCSSLTLIPALDNITM